jgi:O-antigen/teichoic acid export membrane protein
MTPNDDATPAARTNPAAGAASLSLTTDPPQTDEVAEFARGGLFSLVGQAANAVLVFGFMFLAARFLFQVSAGGLFEAMAIVTTASLIATAGADIGLMRVLPMYKRQGRRQVEHAVLVALVPSGLIGGALAIAVFALAPQISSLLVHHLALQSSTTRELRILAPLIPLTGMTTVLLAGSRAWGIKPSVAVQYLFIPALRPAMFAIFVGFGMTGVLAASAWAIPQVLGFVAALLVMFRLLVKMRAAAVGGPLPIEPASNGQSVRGVARHFWGFSAPRFLESILTVFLWGVDIVLVGMLSSSRAAASYTVAVRYVAIAMLGLQAVLVAIPTQISDLMQHSQEASARTLYRVSTWWSIAISWPPAIALAVFAPWFMSLFGRGYTSGSTALVVLAFGVIAGTTSGPCGAVLLMSGKTSISLGTTTLAMAINIPLSVALIPSHGALGAAIAWTASAVATSVVQGYLLWRIFDMHPLGTEFAIVAGASVACFGLYGIAVRALLGQHLLAVCCYVVGSVATYAVAIFFARGQLQLDTFRNLARRTAQASPASSSVPSNGQVTRSSSPVPGSHFGG